MEAPIVILCPMCDLPAHEVERPVEVVPPLVTDMWMRYAPGPFTFIKPCGCIIEHPLNRTPYRYKQ